MMKRKINIGLIGASGKMGQEILRLCAGGAGIQVKALISRNEISGWSKRSEKEKKAALRKKADVWIDFSHPELFEDVLLFAAETQTPLVSGTTGVGAKLETLLARAGKKIPVLWASNMSLGVAVVNEMLKLLSMLEGFDFYIDEIHHLRKIDNPSGTAKTLHATLQNAVGKKVPAPVGHRVGAVYGIHRIGAASAQEMITIEHQALNRAVFAEGAIKAARWLVNQKRGVHNISEVVLAGKGKK